ncbi:hypothetical protein [Paenibacillus humicus]|nr:hypothetical protein [Paenibacillus humicus]
MFEQIWFDIGLKPVLLFLISMGLNDIGVDFPCRRWAWQAAAAAVPAAE